MLQSLSSQRNAPPEPLDLSGGFLVGARLRTLVFLLAVVAINYTWSRPSPVDGIFFCALLLTAFSRQTLNIRNILMFGLVLTWLASVFISSISLSDNPKVVFQFIALTSVVLIGITSCLVATGWGERDFRRFIKVYVFAVVIAALIGIVGFVLQIPAITWDTRPTGFLDDPDMFGVFLIPGMFGSLYMIAQGRGRLLYGTALLLLTVAVALSFSRAAIVAALLWGGASFFAFNRGNLKRATLSALLILVPVVLACVVLYFTNERFAHMLSQRSTIAETYDLGHFGRYNRYLLAFPMILDHPLGLGLFELDKIFPEPIHNIWISSFLNYGWLAGFAWTLLMVLSVQQAWYNWRACRNDLSLYLLFSWLAIMSCAMLHQGERWRFLWMFTGLLWGFNYRNFIAASDELAEVDDEALWREAA